MFGQRKAKKTYTEEGLYEYAVGALGRKMRTVAELKRLMRQKVSGDSEALIDAVIQRLKDQKHLNDTQFAATFTSLRRDNQKFGKRRIVADLAAKGVHKDLIEKAISAGFEDVNEEKQARAYLERKRTRKPGSDKEAARVARMLMRAGFGSGTITRILKRWDVDDAVVSAVEEESGEF